MTHPTLETLERQLRDAAEVAAPETNLRTRKMFGGAGAYAGAGMFASLSGVGLALKLPDDAQAELLRHDGAKPLQYDAEMPPSKRYVVVPDGMRADPDALAPWVRRSIDFAASLPASKARKRRTA